MPSPWDILSGESEKTIETPEREDREIPDNIELGYN
jgi:hypothetical protein